MQLQPLVEYLMRHGAPQFLALIKSAELLPMNDGKMGSHQFQSHKENRRLGSVAAECEFTDIDGVLVSAALILDEDGDPFEIDLWKADFTPLCRWPKSNAITVSQHRAQTAEQVGPSGQDPAAKP